MDTWSNTLINNTIDTLKLSADSEVSANEAERSLDNLISLVKILDEIRSMNSLEHKLDNTTIQNNSSKNGSDVNSNK